MTAAARPKCILFDFYGTLVTFDETGTDQTFQRTHELQTALGGGLSYADFLIRWQEIWREHQARVDLDHSEFLVTEVGHTYLGERLGRAAEHADVESLARLFADDWSAGVRYLPGIREFIAELAADHRLAIVSNTNEIDLVPQHLEGMGIAEFFEIVVLSAALGVRKPNPQIYREALQQLQIEPHEAVFVGDTYGADYVGPQQEGMAAYLIDPQERFEIPAEFRLTELFDLSSRLRQS